MRSRTCRCSSRRRRPRPRRPLHRPQHAPRPAVRHRPARRRWRPRRPRSRPAGTGAGTGCRHHRADHRNGDARDPEDRRLEDDVRGRHARHARPRARPLARLGPSRPDRQHGRRRPPDEPRPSVPRSRPARARRRDGAHRRHRPSRVPRRQDRDRRTQRALDPRSDASVDGDALRLPSKGVHEAAHRRSPRARRRLICLRQPNRSSLAHAAISLGAGALVAASLPPWGWWPLAFVGIAVLRSARRRSAGRCPLPAGRAVLGRLAGAGHGVDVVPQCARLRRGGRDLMPRLQGAALAVIPSGRWRWVALPAALTVAEAIRFSFPFGGVAAGQPRHQSGGGSARSDWPGSAGPCS